MYDNKTMANKSVQSIIASLLIVLLIIISSSSCTTSNNKHYLKKRKKKDCDCSEWSYLNYDSELLKNKLNYLSLG